MSTNTTPVETSSVELSVEADTSEHEEMDKGRFSVETPKTDKSTSHVETKMNSSVKLHVHVETPEDSSQTTKCDSNVDTQIPVQDAVSTDHSPRPVRKPFKIILNPLSEIDLDLWSNKLSDYHRYEPPIDVQEYCNDTGYKLCARKPKITPHSLSLCKTNTVNYAPMLDSDADDTDEVKKATPNKTRPKVDGPSSAVIRAHALIQNNRQNTSFTSS